jgi:DNA-binding NarL/FixJ family response regulator
MRILIIDDHRLFAEAVRTALSGNGLEILPVASTGREGVEAARSQRPDLVLVDLVLPDTSGIDVGRRILQDCPEARVMAVTGLNDTGILQQVMRAGFHGYLTKDSPIALLVESIHAVANGQMVIPHRLAAGAAGDKTSAERDAELLAKQLTPRERSVLILLVEGSASEEIALRMSISPNTVRTHIQNILTKLQVHSRLEAAAFAVRYGLVDVRRERRRA